MSCAVMRTRSPDCRTLPSSRWRTRSTRPIESTGTLRFLNEKADVRAATCSPCTCARRLSSSSVTPSDRYSFVGSPLMLTKGSTAIVGDSAESAGRGRVAYQPPARAIVAASTAAARRSSLWAVGGRWWGREGRVGGGGGGGGRGEASRGGGPP